MGTALMLDCGLVEKGEEPSTREDILSCSFADYFVDDLNLEVDRRLKLTEGAVKQKGGLMAYHFQCHSHLTLRRCPKKKGQAARNVRSRSGRVVLFSLCVVLASA